MALIQTDFFSKSLMRTVTIQAIIPVDKLAVPGMPEREEKPFKTLYLLHGIFGNYTDWVTGTRIMRWAQDKNLAVILPSGENHFYIDHEKSGQYYSAFLGEELVKFTRTLFPLSRKREDTFIAGLSMGGYGAIINGLKYHDTFSCIAGLSSAMILNTAISSTYDDPVPFQRRGFFESVFGDLEKLAGSDWDYRAAILRLQEEHSDIPALYLACGTEDPLISENRKYVDFLREHNIPVTYEEGPGTHSWDFWDTYIKKILEWLPLEDATESIHSGNVGLL